MSRWSIDYNGFGTTNGDWDAITVNWRRSTPVYAEDGITHETTEHVIGGTALVSATSDAAFKTALANARARLTRQTDAVPTTVSPAAGALLIKIGSEKIVDIEGKDDVLGSPSGVFTINEIHGVRTALIGFEIRYHLFETFGDDVTTYNVSSHWWKQTFDHDKIGNTTLTVTGALTVRSNATAGENATELGPNPDLYRNLVMPQLPVGFRVESEQWATDESAVRLLYQVVLRQYTRAMLGPARDGNARFSWKRAIMAGRDGALGLKVFSGELEGDETVGPGRLVNALVEIASSRIDFVKDQVLSIEMIEVDMLNKNRIGLNATALGAGGKVGSSVEPLDIGIGFTSLSDPSNDVSEFYSIPDEYGNRLIRSVRRSLFNATSTPAYTTETFPKAQTEDQSSTSSAFAQLPDYIFEAIQSGIVPAGDEAASVQEEHRENPYIAFSVDEKVRVDTGVLVMRSQSLGGSDLPYQIHKPRVTVHTTYQMARKGLAPDRMMLTCPAGSVIISEDYNVQAGPLDGNNNREYHAVYERVLEIMDPGGNGTMFTTVNIPGFSISIRQWKPNEEQQLSLPFDPRTQSSSARTLFESFGDFKFKLNLTNYVC